ELSGGQSNESYVDMPFVLKVNFVYLSCLCRFRPENSGAPNSECCKGPDGGIYIDGAGPGEIPTKAQEAYLILVCSETQGAIGYAREELGITANPTARPTNVETSSPTQEPSAELTMSPTNPPSTPPLTKAPTQSPSKKPISLTPTLTPSTVQPSASPTLEPSTSSPTMKPTTLSPSLSPNETPTRTVSPSLSRHETPTTLMPILVTSTPTKQPIAGITPTTLGPSLIETPTVAVTNIPTSGVTQEPTLSAQPTSSSGEIIPPTTDDSITPPSPTTDDSITPPTPTTTDDSISTPTSPTNPDDPDAVEKQPGDGDQESDSISAGGIAGIVIASAFVAFVAAYALGKKRRRDDEDDPDLQEVRNRDLDADLEAGKAVDLEAAAMIPVQEERKLGDGGGGGANKSLGDDSDNIGDIVIGSSGSYDASAGYIPTSPDTARSPPPSDVPLISGMPSSPTRSKVGAKETTSSSYDDSSSAGESGWSSSAGLSSLNTASFDAGSLTDEGLLLSSPDKIMATLGAAEIATAAAGSTQRDARPTFVPASDNSPGDDSSDVSYEENAPMSAALTVHGLDSDHPTSPPAKAKVTREDLNRAIDAGDWAVVGATAALLADTTHASSMSSAESQGGIRSSESFQTTESSNHQAAELDRMVDTGDWEGVVLAAAQYEGSSGLNQDEDTHMLSKDNTSESGEQSLKDLAEIRAEVERLVRRVVPDEVDNIDEMMQQFEGREPELVETLRTMQERSVAKRARDAVQKTAKLEAKAKASLSSNKSVESSSSDLSHYAGSASSSVSDYVPSSSGGDEDSSSLTDSSISDLGTESSSRKTVQSSLGLAIEKGDWRAVGEAAALMGTGEGSSIIQDDSGSSLNTSLSQAESSKSKADRINHLDSLIAKGDWAGIVAAAGTYQAMDDTFGAGGQTQEERDALAQATMWQEIANQSRQEGGAEAKGAKDAADWAISRAMKSASDAAALKGGDDESV
ncbi:hypothetical protein ACHAXR_006057, partial [Thalassiosira sp. AJA248-18]